MVTHMQISHHAVRAPWHLQHAHLYTCTPCLACHALQKTLIAMVGGIVCLTSQKPSEVSSCKHVSKAIDACRAAITKLHQAH